MRQLSPVTALSPAHGFLQYVVERGPLRFVGLDTVVPGQGGGELCAERLAWLDTTLAEKRDMPTLVLMHHPPFLTGIAHMDRIGLTGRDCFASVMRRHAQVDAMLCATCLCRSTRRRPRSDGI
jgi:3',5'-cyclic AMP phosphodiesterase CpdA